jgi:hypothetical protein
MKYLLIFLLFPVSLFSQEVSVKHIHNNTTIKVVGGRDITFGVKETLEEILIEKNYKLNDSTGMAVEVNIDSVESPHQVLNIIGMKWLKKDYIITTSVCIGERCYTGKGKRTAYVFAAFLDVENNEVPLNKKTFSKALQKSLEDASQFKQYNE